MATGGYLRVLSACLSLVIPHSVFDVVIRFCFGGCYILLWNLCLGPVCRWLSRIQCPCGILWCLPELHCFGVGLFVAGYPAFSVRRSSVVVTLMLRFSSFIPFVAGLGCLLMGLVLHRVRYLCDPFRFCFIHGCS